MASALQIRLLTSSDLPFAEALSRNAGWNQTDADWKRFQLAEPLGCFIAEWDHTPVGTITTTRYAGGLAWIGMLLVQPEHQGRGIGTQLLDHAIAYLRQMKATCIKLDATPAGQPIYEGRGFKPEWSLQRWMANPARLSFPFPGHRTRFWRDADIEPMRQLDAEAFGTCRWAMLRRMEGNSTHWLVNAVPKGRLNGIGMARRGARAHYLGPIVAGNLSSAAGLVKALLQSLGKQRVFWDIPDHQEMTIELARQLGFHPQRTLVRMFLGEDNIPGRPEMIYGLAGPEIG